MTKCQYFPFGLLKAVKKLHTCSLKIIFYFILFLKIVVKQQSNCNKKIVWIYRSFYIYIAKQKLENNNEYHEMCMDFKQLPKNFGARTISCAIYLYMCLWKDLIRSLEL